MEVLKWKNEAAGGKEFCPNFGAAGEQNLVTKPLPSTTSTKEFLLNH